MSDKVTIGGIPLKFEPPATDSDEKYVYGVNQSVIDRANVKMEAEGSSWRFVETSRVGGVSVYELRRVESDG
jgi:hypothetical protein